MWAFGESSWWVWLWLCFAILVGGRIPALVAFFWLIDVTFRYSVLFFLWATIDSLYCIFFLVLWAGALKTGTLQWMQHN